MVTTTQKHCCRPACHCPPMVSAVGLAAASGDGVISVAAALGTQQK
jgi:hypothetical protein